MQTNAIANVNKKLVNRTVSFENELVPLNGHICQFAEFDNSTEDSIPSKHNFNTEQL